MNVDELKVGDEVEVVLSLGLAGSRLTKPGRLIAMTADTDGPICTVLYRGARGDETVQRRRQWVAASRPISATSEGG